MKILFLGDKTNLLYKKLKDIENNIDIISDKLKKEDVKKKKYNFIISFGYRHIVKQEIIDLFQDNNIINLHISYLPFNRGSDPNLWSILDNTPSGVTIHLLEKGLDTGNILLQKRVFFNDEIDTLETSYNKLINEMTELFLENWELIKNKKIIPIPQDNTKKTLHYLKHRPDYNLLLPNGFQTKIIDIKKNFSNINNQILKKNIIPYGKQTLDEKDKQAVIEVLEENTYLTTGPRVNKFEQKVCSYIGCSYGVAVNSGTAALHCATFAAGIQKDDEVIVSAISFVASANCILYQGGKPVFCDIDPETLNIDVSKIEGLITEKTKAIIMVDMCGQPCHYDEIREICNKHNLILIQDAAHSLGSSYQGKKVGSYADISCLSFHPVKNITTCEGGMMVTNNEIYYKKANAFRSHGISRDFKEREKANSHYYEMNILGFNYRIPDVLCALGISQMDKLDSFIQRRNEIAKKYDHFFEQFKDFVEPLKNHYNCAYHIYVIKLNTEKIGKSRDKVFKELKESGIGVNVHYMPIYLHPYYQELGYQKGLCPESEKVYEQMITLPIFPLLKDEEVEIICEKIMTITLNRTHYTYLI